MSALRSSPPAPGAFLCPRCGSTLQSGQDWCLDCGYAARTRIHPPPGWRLPIAATLLVAALLAAGIAFGLVALLDKGHTTTPAAATVTTPTTLTTPTTPAPTATTPTTPGATVPGASTIPTTPTTVTPATVVPSPRSRVPTTPGTTTPRTPTIPRLGIQGTP